MAKPGSYNLDIYRGDTQQWQFVLWEDEDKTQPIDLTGVAVMAEIRDKPAGAKITEIACTVVDPNIINAYLSADISHALPIKAGYWDLELTYPGDIVTTILAGSVTITPDITNSTPAP